MFAAVLDTSVLWPSLQRDFLLSLAAEGSFRPMWSTAILDELLYHEAKKLVEREKKPEDEAERAAQRLIHQMSQAFDDALVTDWEPLEGSYGLPDPDDEHVVAAAVMGGAEVIVTENLKHFPPAKLPASIRAVPARDFAHDTVRQHLTQACRAVIAIMRAQRTARPPQAHGGRSAVDSGRAVQDDGGCRTSLRCSGAARCTSVRGTNPAGAWLQ